MAGGGASILETPSYVAAAVFAFFMIVSFALEKALHHVRHKLAECRRSGLRIAFDSLVMEVMLLGFISLMLTVLQDEIASICVPKHTKNDHWVMISRIEHCDPCLEHTQRLSDKFKAEQQCPFWDDAKGGKDPYSGAGEYSGIDGAVKKEGGKAHHLRRHLLAGGSVESECGEGKEQFVSVETLHEVHTGIFLLAIVHIVNSVLMILLASLRLRFWRRYKIDDDVHASCVAVKVENDMESSMKIDNKEVAETVNNYAQSQPSPNGHPILHWTASERDLSKPHNYILECLICFIKQFVKPISPEEFRLLRASFMLTHRRTRNFDFIDYITQGLDQDFSKVVGISLSGWFTMTVVILIYPPLDWTSWFAVLIQAVFASVGFIVTSKLVHIVRSVTRGGKVHELDPSVFWFKKPQLLLYFVKFVLFLNAIVLAVTTFFAWQFGTRSCYFRGRSPGMSVTGEDFTWIVMLLINMASFSHISFVTLPTYSIVIHMTSNQWREHLVSDVVRTRMLELASQVKKKGNATSSGESMDNETNEA